MDGSDKMPVLSSNKRPYVTLSQRSEINADYGRGHADSLVITDTIQMDRQLCFVSLSVGPG